MGEKIKEYIRELVARYVAAAGADREHEVFVVDVLVRGGESGRKIELLVDTESGIEVGECVRLTREIRDAIEADEEMLREVGEMYQLTVSSPGLGGAIRNERQYLRQVGHLLKVQYLDAEDEEQELVGRLVGVELEEGSGQLLRLEPKAKKKKKGQKGAQVEIGPVEIALGRIVKAVVEIEF
ncbi:MULTISPECIES: hypothetical protein [Prosthecochloris]|uniref:Ribosome maturation factor RimP n=1 Tax=Prosthecochloris vibrioformis TaxID=1098 RepID=A0A5C4RZ97_PROVB|nr:MULTISPECIES: hypothetical protein [Prosthecochloris]ANT64181.1 ribosome maturation protein RimP [Prosthecochloris sp. CIB 2401]TNJ36613.1 ribosome maturation factor RimP [Prosthecochloris vibrioformis]